MLKLSLDLLEGRPSRSKIDCVRKILSTLIEYNQPNEFAGPVNVQFIGPPAPPDPERTAEGISAEQELTGGV